MMTIPAIVADELGKHLADDLRRLFGSAHRDEAEQLDGIARVALAGANCLTCRPPEIGRGRASITH